MGIADVGIEASVAALARISTDRPSDRQVPAPRLVVTLGLYGSASTWLFNVVRETLNAAHGAERVCAYYADAITLILQDGAIPGRFVVVKMHVGDASLAGFVHLAQPLLLLSVRDPRDAVVSLMQRFGQDFEKAASRVVQSARRILFFAAAGHPVLRYEDDFFTRPETLDAIAARLGVTLRDEIKAAIFAGYQTASVRKFAADVAHLPPGRLDGNPADLFDRVTHIHRNHIGDGMIGKWKERLSAPESAALTEALGDFITTFGY